MTQTQNISIKMWSVSLVFHFISWPIWLQQHCSRITFWVLLCLCSQGSKREYDSPFPLARRVTSQWNPGEEALQYTKSMNITMFSDYQDEKSLLATETQVGLLNCFNPTSITQREGLLSFIDISTELRDWNRDISLLSHSPWLSIKAQ